MKIDFCLKNQDGKKICLKDFKGKWLIVYFYPKDDTPGCTTEAIEFTKNIHKFKELKTDVIGISSDTIESHCKFIKKYGLNLQLLYDQENKIAKKFKAYGNKNLYGKEVRGIIRSTFLINPKGEIIYSWKNVKVEGHVEEVLEKLKYLQK